MEKIRNEFDQLKRVIKINKKNYIIKNETMFPFLFQIVVGLETMFPTSVICESAFSLLKYDKTDQTNQLKANTVDAIMRIKYSSTDELHEIIDKLIKEKDLFWKSLKKKAKDDIERDSEC